VFNFTYDTTNPLIALISPSNGSMQSSSTIVLQYNVSEANNVTNCTMHYRGTETDNTSISSGTNTFSIYENQQGGPYEWYITCYDNSGNLGTSFTNQFYVGWSETVDGGVGSSVGMDTTDGREEKIEEDKVKVTDSLISEIKEKILQIGTAFSPKHPYLGFGFFCLLMYIAYLFITVGPAYIKKKKIG